MAFSNSVLFTAQYHEGSADLGNQDFEENPEVIHQIDSNVISKTPNGDPDDPEISYTLDS